MPAIGQELSSINFGSIIGGTLNALVEAQSQAAYTTMEFIHSVGFTSESEKDIKKPTYVQFQYAKELSPYMPATESEAERPAVVKDMILDVPILTLLPIPYVRIDDATIDFNVKINSVTNTSNTESSSYGGSAEVSTSFSFLRFKASAKLNATLSNQKSSTNSEEVKRDYSLSIHIHAVQDQIPAGINRLLDILEDSIVAHTAPTT